MRSMLIVTAALALPLAACSKEPSISATNATSAEVQQKVAAAAATGDTITIEPGRWEGSMMIHELDIPGMPADAKAQMKAHMGGAKSFVNCVTQEDVKAQKAFFTGDDNDKNCKYDQFTLSGGKIDAKMSCNQGDGGKMAMTMTGAYTPQSYHMDMTSRSEGAGPAGPAGAMAMKMSVEAKRVGACTGSKDEL